MEQEPSQPDIEDSAEVNEIEAADLAAKLDPLLRAENPDVTLTREDLMEILQGLNREAVYGNLYGVLLEEGVEDPDELLRQLDIFE
jgi:hypothetical protein